MSRVCDICKKSYHKANIVNKLRGQYNRCGIKKQRVNLQWKKIDGKKVRVCTKCIKTLTKTPRKKKGK